MVQGDEVGLSHLHADPSANLNELGNELPDRLFISLRENGRPILQRLAVIEPTVGQRTTPISLIPSDESKKSKGTGIFSDDEEVERKGRGDREKSE